MSHPTKIFVILGTLLLAASVTSVSAQQSTVTGTLVDSAGNPIPGAMLRFVPVEVGDGVEATAKTRKKGTFLLGLLRPGVYDLLVEAEGYVVDSVAAKAVGTDRRVAWEVGGAVGPDRPFQFRAGDGERITLDVVLGKAVSIASGAGEQALMSADDALAALAGKVQRGECDSALPELDTLIADNPEKAPAHYLAGYCRANAGRLVDAERDVRRALELDADLSGAALLHGEILTRMGRVDDAERLFRAEIERTTENAVELDAWIALGILYRDAERHADAIAAFEHVLELAPERPEAYVELSTLYTKAGDPARAEQILERSRDAGEMDPAALVNVGIDYYNRNDCDGALKVMRQVTALEGLQAGIAATAHSTIARCLVQSGDRAGAAAALSTALGIEANGPAAEENRRLLDALTKSGS